MQLEDFDYHLPPERIAQAPAEPRDSARLMVLHRAENRAEHCIFHELGQFLQPGDVLVFNQTRVLPARLHGHKAETGGKIELLLLEKHDALTWAGLIGGKTKPGIRLTFGEGEQSLAAEVIEEMEGGERLVRFDKPVESVLESIGETPLPPYITAPLSNPERYQTVYARDPGSAAAPTAGLHFTPGLLLALRDQGVKLAYCTLHIGLDTFQPVKVSRVEEHRMHSEQAVLTAENARIINEAKLAGGRIIAVGTTSVRVLETAAMRSAGLSDPYDQAAVCPWRPVQAIEERTELFIRPGYRFRAVDGLITNFHLPHSTLLMLVSAFAGQLANAPDAGRQMILGAYAKAVTQGYRFYSFGDAMLML